MPALAVVYVVFEPLLTVFNSAPLGTARAEGIIRNVNTLEDFKNMDKTAMLKTAGRQVGQYDILLRGGRC